MGKWRKQMARLLVEVVRRLVGGALRQEGLNDYVLEDDQAWITIRNPATPGTFGGLSVKVQETDDGVVCDVFRLHHEDESPVGSTWVTWDEGEEPELNDRSERFAALYGTQIGAINERQDAGQLTYAEAQAMIKPLLAAWKEADPTGPDGPNGVVWLVCPKGQADPEQNGSHGSPFKDTRAGVIQAGGWIECDLCGDRCIEYATHGLSQPEAPTAPGVDMWTQRTIDRAQAQEQKAVKHRELPLSKEFPNHLDDPANQAEIRDGGCECGEKGHCCTDCPVYCVQEAVKTPKELAEMLILNLGYSALANETGQMSCNDYEAHVAETVDELGKIGFDELGRENEPQPCSECGETFTDPFETTSIEDHGRCVGCQKEWQMKDRPEAQECEDCELMFTDAEDTASIVEHGRCEKCLAKHLAGEREQSVSDQPSRSRKELTGYEVSHGLDTKEE